jgi:uncharacterized MAPEG superfamily protein
MQTSAIDPGNVMALGGAAIALWLKGIALSLTQAWIRVRNRTMTLPEDARMLRVPQASEDHPRVRVLAQAWRNELEASPALMALAVSYVLLGGADPAFRWALGVYVIARCVQGFAQATARQPSRTLAWLVGVVAASCVAVLLLHQLLGVTNWR